MISRPPHPLTIRRDAAQATLDKYKDIPFSFSDGRDCAKMCAFLLKQLGRPIALSKVGNYKTPLAAMRALKKSFGVSSLPELADTMFERIPPASAIVGDIIEVEGTGPLGTLTVALGNNLVITYHEDVVGAVVGRLQQPIAAWRTIPL